MYPFEIFLKYCCENFAVRKCRQKDTEAHLPPYTPVVRYVRDGGGVAVGTQSVQVVLLTVILHIIVNRPVNVKTRERDLETTQ